MRAALRFVHELQSSEAFTRTARVQVDLFGSLALTGIGHGTDRAILLGLSGHAPDTVDPAQIESILAAHPPIPIPLPRRHTHNPLQRTHRPSLPSQPDVPRPHPPTHPNGITFTAFDDDCVHHRRPTPSTPSEEASSSPTQSSKPSTTQRTGPPAPAPSPIPSAAQPNSSPPPPSTTSPSLIYCSRTK